MTRRESRFFLKFSLTSGIFLLVIGYALFQARYLILGPQVTISTPISGSQVNSPLVTIEGTAQNISSLTLNSQNILVDPQGDFKQQLLLSEGYNIITITAEDKFKRTVQKQIELTFHDHGV